MALTVTTASPQEVARLFREYADLLSLYASDQLAARRWQHGKEKERCELRAEVYADLARELMEMEFVAAAPVKAQIEKTEE